MEVDDQYLLHAYAITTDLAMWLLRKVIGAPDGGPGAVGPGDERHGQLGSPRTAFTCHYCVARR